MNRRKLKVNPWALFRPLCWIKGHKWKPGIHDGGDCSRCLGDKPWPVVARLFR